MHLSYVLPDPISYRDWREFEGDLACMRQAGYEAIELQIPDPTEFDEERVGRSLDAVGYAMCAFQTGSTYYSRGNCLCTANEAIRRRTIDLLKSFVALAARWQAVIVFGSLQGRLSDEPDRAVGAARIREAIDEVGQYASGKGVTLAFEPVQHGEVGFHIFFIVRPGTRRASACSAGVWYHNPQMVREPMAPVVPCRPSACAGARPRRRTRWRSPFAMKTLGEIEAAICDRHQRALSRSTWAGGRRTSMPT